MKLTQHLCRWFIMLTIVFAATTFENNHAYALKNDPTTLTVATMWECKPHSMKARRSRFFNESEILDTLIKLDYDMQLIPGLATSWKRTGDTEWLFKLRQGVTFHDGTPLTAKAVVFSFDRVIALLPYADGLLDIAEMKAEGPLSVKVRTNKPFAGLANQMTDAITGIYAASSFDSSGKFKMPIGTGPYKFVSYKKQDRTIAERFDGYWGPKPAIKRVVYRYIPDHAARTLSLETGEIDLAVNIPPADVDRMARNKAYQVYRDPAAGLYYMVFNTAGSSAFADPRVRTAVNLLVDRESLVTHGLDGVGAPAWKFFSPQFGLVPDSVPRYSLDKSRAEKLLKEAGFTKSGNSWEKNGKPLKLSLISYSSRTEMPVITETVANMLNQAGIKTSVKMYTWPGMLSLVRKGKYDAYTVFWTPEMTGHPDMHLKAHFHSTQSMMYNSYKDAKLDQLIIRARGLDAGSERDRTYGMAMEIIHRDAPVMPLVHKIYVAASNDKVKGFKVHPSGFFYNFKAVSKN